MSQSQYECGQCGNLFTGASENDCPYCPQNRKCILRKQADGTHYKPSVYMSRDGGNTWEWCSTMEGVDRKGVSYEEAMDYAKRHASGVLVIA